MQRKRFARSRKMRNVSLFFKISLKTVSGKNAKFSPSFTKTHFHFHNFIAEFIFAKKCEISAEKFAKYERKFCVFCKSLRSLKTLLVTNSLLNVFQIVLKSIFLDPKNCKENLFDYYKHFLPFFLKMMAIYLLKLLTN